jgi:hypothetical protein
MAIGMGYILLIMIPLIGGGGVIFHLLSKRLTIIVGKTCPHCAETIK